MKKDFFTGCLLLLCTFFGQQLAAQTLTWNPQLPLQQKKVVFTYQPKGGDLEFSNDPKAMLACFNGSQWKTMALNLTKDKDHLLAEYSVPAGVTFMALKFYQGDVLTPEAADNNNGKGYFSRVLSPKGKEVAGSFLAEAAFRAGLTEDWTLTSFLNPQKNAKSIDSLLKKEEKQAHSAHRPYLFTYLDLKQITMPAPAFSAYADEQIKAEIKKGNLNEDLLADMQRYYLKLKDSTGAAMVTQLIFQHYPKSGTARYLAFRSATNGKSGNDLVAAYEGYLKKYPYTDWKKSPDSKGYIYYEIFRGLGAKYFESGQTDKFLALFKDIDFKTANEIYRWNITKGQMMEKVDRKMLYGISNQILPYLMERKEDLSYLTDFENDREKAQANADHQLDDRLFTHIFLANDQADYAGGKKYFQYLSKAGSYSNADLNAIHLNILTHLQEEQAIKPLLEHSVAENAVTPKMFTKLKSIYLDEHQNKEDGYEQYLASLVPVDKKTEMRMHVMDNMVNYPLQPFSLEDADGKMVHSKDWAGKIVVIDFWATWCRPCIMAFPGMQLLVDQYAKDPAVAVYMIGTMQFGDYKAKSVNYVRSEGFRFNLLHDAVGAKGEQDQVFKSLVPLFKSSAIPRKIIVKNGVVRYSSEGYSGSPSQLRDELSMAIEILRAEK